MGFIDTSDQPWLPYFYNVVHAVGQYCPNLRDDVMLVQHLLKCVYDMQPPYSKPAGQMKIDGFCGPITLNWIYRFQTDTNKANGAPLIIVDDRVDRVRNRSLIGGISNKMYTLAVLNYNAAVLNPDGWVKAQYTIPLQSSSTVPPPGYDYIPPQTVPATGGA